MLVLDEERLQYIFNEITKGFAHSPLEIIIFFISVIAIVAGFLFVSRQYAKARKEKIEKEARSKYEKIIEKLSLTPQQLKTLEILQHYLPKQNPVNLLVENRHIFNICTNLLKSETDRYDSEISALRFKLGFRISGSTRVPVSSIDLPDGARLIMVINNRLQKNGILSKVTEQYLEIEPGRNGLLKIHTGSPLRVYFKNQNGIFYFNSKIIAQTRGTLRIAHSERIRKIQRRQYYRKKVKLLSLVRVINRDPGYRKVIIMDLSGGGASFQFIDYSPDLRPGETIELVTPPIKRKPVKATAKIVRITDRGKLYHIEFEEISENLREEIISYLFSKH